MNEQALQQFIEDMPQINEAAYCSFFHGVSHWKNVEKFGLLLAREYPDADIDVIRWFAYLHDCMRGKEEAFQEHGSVAALFIRKIRKTYLKDLSDVQIKQLRQACKYHTIRRRTKDITVNICFDADRLDLWRVGIKPDPKQMAKNAGSKYAELSEEEIYNLI